jgi:hypothetical protein
MQSKEDDKEAEVDLEALNSRIDLMNVWTEAEDDLDQECARFIEAELEKDVDEEMRDGESQNKTEKELMDEAWAAYDKVVAEDPSPLPKYSQPVAEINP